MLSDRERRQLELIERGLTESDPVFTSRWHRLNTDELTASAAAPVAALPLAGSAAPPVPAEVSYPTPQEPLISMRRAGPAATMLLGTGLLLLVGGVVTMLLPLAAVGIVLSMAGLARAVVVSLFDPPEGPGTPGR